MRRSESGLDPKQAHVVSQWAHDRPLISCRFDPLGRYVYCGSEDNLIERYQLANGARTVFSGGHSTWVRTFAFSTDGSFVVSGGYDGKLTWWETACTAPASMRSVSAHGSSWIRATEVSPDGKLLASAGNGNGGFVLFWKPDTEKDYDRFQLPNIARDMDLHGDGVTVATAHHERHVRIVRLTARSADV